MAIEKYIIDTKLKGWDIGDSHRYKNENGEISLLYPCTETFQMYQIFCIEGSLFKGVKNYKTLTWAEKKSTSY